MKWCGILLFAVGAFEILRMLLRAEHRRIREAEGLYLLLRQIKRDISERAVPLGEIYASFENDALAGTGFLAALRSDGLLCALEGGYLCLPREDLRPIVLFAGGLGMRFWEEEKNACEQALERMLGLCEAYRAELPRRMKLKRTFLLTGAGMLILLLL